VDYRTTWQDMMDFTERRSPERVDEIWFLEHPPVYTLGLNGHLEHLLDPGSIPVIPTDRGGQVTYHGPGQLVVYPLIALARRSVGPRQLVRLLEQATIDCLRDFGITGHGRAEAPGVYVESRKIASIGLRIRRGASYHGLALNVSNDLGPFLGIHPCGFRGLEMTRVADCGGPSDLEVVGHRLEAHLLSQLRSLPRGAASVQADGGGASRKA
jgi:lipoyl(octanoyl) transferase